MLIYWDFLGNFGLPLNELTLMKRNMVVIDECYYQHIVNLKSLEFFFVTRDKSVNSPTSQKM